MFITFLGIFDYIKNFLVIFIFAAFFRKFSEVKKIFNFLFIASVLIAVIAFIQEIWAMGARHIVGNFLHEKEIYLFSNHLNNKYFWRFGIYRAPSLMEDANYLGLYCLLFLTLHMCLSKKINFLGFFSLYSGIFLSVSRVTYTGFVFIAGLQIFKGRRWLIILLIPILMLLFKMMDFPDSNIFKTVKVAESSKNTMPLRIYLRSKAIEVWNDNPILGAGPGMFGGTIAFKYKPSIYEKYNFSPTFASLDQFYPQVLAEIGIIGLVAFMGLIISLPIIFLILRQQAITVEKKALYTGLALLPIIIFIYSFGYGLNIASFLFTYCALAGMGLGCKSPKLHTFN